tara:strand:+ start:1904 stop:2275 length:372 start_codon:yes stop_codon:yes gene_type:complete
VKTLVLFLSLISGYASAHQFTPTYPELTPSHIEGVYKADMVLLNTRKDIKYYALSVFTKDWKPVRFASQNKLVRLGFRERKYLSIYISKMDIAKVEYICSKSKILSSVKDTSIVASRICSKIK